MTGMTLALRGLAEAGAVAGPLLVGLARREAPALKADPIAAPVERSSRAPLVANVAALAVFFSSLWLPFPVPGVPDGALPVVAGVGVVLVVAGAVVMNWARRSLGPAWRLAPASSRQTGLATAGPYRFVRHPIYLGMAVSFFGTALAFANWVSLLAYLLGVLPSLIGRAVVEERVLARVFGEDYAAYRRRTPMLIPACCDCFFPSC